LRRTLQSVDNGGGKHILLQFHPEKTRRGSGFQMATAFITHRDCWLHDMGAHHPECPERLSAISDRLIAAGLDLYLSYYDAPLATLEQIARVHPPEYVRRIAESAPANGIVHLDPDTAMSAGTWQAALRSAGAGILATDLVMRGEVDNAFCSVRPPGHHAERARAMGFCFFNNIAIAAMHALAEHGLERVAIADFDVHHGNGTEDIFADDPRILMVGTFQHPFYPYSGTEATATNMVNVPISAGTRSDGFREAVERAWLPALRRFAPQAIFISAGFDAHYEDDMASLGLVESDYAWVTEQLKAVAAESAQGRIVSMLEGGYALSALGRSVAVHVKALADL
jgi:acetoin utilization deacetylase AcuC-like enzyme